MNLSAFGSQLRIRWIVNRISIPVIYSLISLWLIIFADYFFRLGVIWRVAFCGLVTIIFTLKIKNLLRDLIPPSEDELYFLACQYHEHQAYSVDPKNLTLPKEKLGPWPIKIFFIIALLLSVPFLLPSGRLGLKRILLLSGEWPKKTQIVNVSIPQYVEEGSPITIQFQLKGTIPPLVRLNVNNDEKLLVGNGMTDWVYDFFHPSGKLSISLTAGDDSVSQMKTIVLPKPIIEATQIIWQEPNYLGGKVKTHPGSEISVVEGSKVTLRAKVKNTDSIIFHGINQFPDETGWVSCDIGLLSQDKDISLKASSHPNLAVNDILTFRLTSLSDRAPHVDIREPSNQSYYLKDSSVTLSFKCRDDYGLKSASILLNDHELTSFSLRGLDQSRSIDFKLNEFEAPFEKKLQLLVKVKDNKEQWGSSEKLQIDIIDKETFQQRLIEQQQSIQRHLESLLSSMSRRYTRAQTGELLERHIENNNLREDIERSEDIVSRFDDFLFHADQYDGLESDVLEARKDRNYLKKNVINLLTLLLTEKDRRLNRQQETIRHLEEMSQRLARRQNFHLVIRLLDQMITRQNQVIQSIP